MLVGEARKGRFGLFADIVYTDIEMEDPVPYGILYSAVDSQTKSMYAQVLVVVYRAATLFSKTVENLINERSKYEKNQSFFKNAYGYAVFPTIGKAGIGIGGSYGKGQVYKGGKVTGEVSVIKGSIGFQLGAQAFSEMIFLKDKRAYDEFTSGEFEFDATASAVAITAGAQAKAGTEGATAGASAGPATGEQAKINYHKGMAVFVHTKGGLMYEASIGGQKFTFKPKK